MDQLRLAHGRPVMISPLHRLNLPVELRPVTRVDWRDLLVADEQRLAIDTLAEAHTVLASADTIMRCLCAHTVKQVLIPIALRFRTLVTNAMALTLTLGR